MYQLYFFFPFLVIARLWSDGPFTKRMPATLSTALWLYGALTFAVFFSYVAKWMVVYGPELLPAGMAEALEGARSLP